MKTFIKLCVISIFVVGFSYISMAQQHQQQRKDPPSIEERVNRAIKIITKNIELSDLEKEKIRNSFSEFYEKVDEVLKSGERPDKSVMKGYEKERDTKIKLVLSEEKYEDYLRMTCYLRPQRNKDNRRQPDTSRPKN